MWDEKEGRDVNGTGDTGLDHPWDCCLGRVELGKSLLFHPGIGVAALPYNSEDPPSPVSPKISWMSALCAWRLIF